MASKPTVLGYVKTITENYDAQVRSMALQDLHNYVEKYEGKLDASLQVPVRDCLLKGLEDKGQDVSTNAVKCLKAMVQCFAPEEVHVVVEKLAGMVVDPDQEEFRDVFREALGTVMKNLPTEHAKLTAPKIVNILLKGLVITKQDSVTIKLLSIELISSLLEMFGAEVKASHQQLLNALTALLNHDDEDVQKQASLALGPLAATLEEEDFKKLMGDYIVKGVKGKKPEVYIQSLKTISKFAGVRVGEYLDDVVPVLERYCQTESKTGDEDHSLLYQNCLQAFESIIVRCPNKIGKYLTQILDLALKMLKHDPNLATNEDGGGAAMADDEDWGDDAGGGEDWGDDDGGGWGGDADKEAAAGAGWAEMGDVPQSSLGDEAYKVRRAAAACLSSYIRSKSSTLKDNYAKLSEALIERFSERDESVQEEVLIAFRDLLQESVTGLPEENRDPAEDFSRPPSLVRQKSSYDVLEQKIGQAISSLVAIKADRPSAVLIARLMVLERFTLVVRGDLADYLNEILPLAHTGAKAAATQTGLHTAAFGLFNTLLGKHKYVDLKPYVGDISSTVLSCLPTAAESVKVDILFVMASLAHAIKGQGLMDIENGLYKATYTIFVQQDTQQSIKVATISTMAMCISSASKSPDAQLKQVGPLLIDRLASEALRGPILNAITHIAKAEQKVDLSSFVSTKPLTDMCSFLRQASTKLRAETMQCAEALIKTHSAAAKEKDVDDFLAEASKNIGENLYMSHLVLEFLATALAVNPKTAIQIAKDSFPSAMQLVTSPILQGACLDSIKKFFQHCVVYGDKVSHLAYGSVLKALLDTATAVLPDQSFTAVAQSIAAITTAKTVDAKTANATVVAFIKNISSNSASHIKVVSLLSIGEIGRQFDLGSHQGIEDVLFGAFNDKEAKVGNAASFALGSIAISDMKKFLPILMNLIKTQPKYQFLLLSALKVAIKNGTRAQIKDYVDTIIPVLYHGVNSPEEGTRNMVAECLGSLASIDMHKIMPTLQKEASESKEASKKTVFLTALRFAFNPDLNWGWVCDNLDIFCKFLTDADLVVRQEAVTTITSLLNCNANIISRDRLANVILPALYSETRPHEDFIKTVNFMGLVQVFDKGLTLRKAVFFALDTLLKNAGDRINLQLFIESILPGLKDHDVDMVVFVFHLLNSIAKSFPSVLCEFLDSLPTNYLLPLVKEHKAMADQKNIDCIRAILESMLTWNQMPGVELCSKYTHFFKQVQNTASIATVLVEAKLAVGV